MDRWKSVRVLDILPLASESIEFPFPSRAGPCISAHESPLRQGLFVIWVYILLRSDSQRLPSTSITRKYLLSPNPTNNEPHQLKLQSSTFLQSAYSVIRHISYAGHIEFFDYSRNRTQRVLSLRELDRITDDSDGVVDLPDTGDHVHVSAYSGALTYATHRSVVINYYL